MDYHAKEHIVLREMIFVLETVVYGNHLSSVTWHGDHSEPVPLSRSRRAHEVYHCHEN